MMTVAWLGISLTVIDISALPFPRKNERPRYPFDWRIIKVDLSKEDAERTIRRFIDDMKQFLSEATIEETTRFIKVVQLTTNTAIEDGLESPVFLLVWNGILVIIPLSII
ncbi:MAG: hypothetical protein ACTSUE_10325 [Promethearchaeota archaeon]